MSGNIPALNRAQDVETICAHCAKAFHPIKQRIKTQKFCSERCFREDKKARNRAPESFWKSVEKTGYCWLWTGNIDNDGYGQLPSGGGAHRRAWELVNGYKAPRLTNGCGNRKCVRPHLEHWRSSK